MILCDEIKVMRSPNCKICRVVIEKRTVLKNSRVYYHCDECGFISLDSRLLLSPDEERARYDLHENSLDNSGYLNFLRNFIELAVKPYPVQKILDYGSGPNPNLANLLKGLGYEVDIYDPYYAPCNAILEASYDLIVSTETFEHFSDPLKELRFINSLLRPQAYLAIMTSFACSYEDFKAWRYKDDETHIAFYSMQTFQKLTELFSMKVIYTNHKNIVVLQRNFTY